MEPNYYGGEHYPANILAVDIEHAPDFTASGTLTSFRDFDDHYWTANDVETRWHELRREAGGKPVTLWFTNLATGVKASVKSDGLEIRTTGKVTFQELWGLHQVKTQVDPQVAGLLVHEQDYLREASGG